MNRQLIINFFKDRLWLTVIFLMNSLLIGLFYFLSTNSYVEIIYPAAISVFLYVILLGVEWFRYSRYNSKLMLHSDDMYYDFEPANREQKNVSLIINRIHKHYEEKIFAVELENQERKHFTSQWIHNMKTPVSVIDMIIQKAFSEETFNKKTMENIKEENEKLLNNLEQALNLSRLDDFSRDYVPEAVDIVASIKKVINNRKNQFIYSRLYPKLQVPAEPILVLSDTKWNEAIIEQLVSNAIKYSSPGKTIYFIIKHDSNHVSLTIKDEGIGIPVHDLKRVFEPFFTGDNGRNNRNTSGIGLYICATIAKKLGSTISIKSDVGVGTEVTVTYLAKM